MMIIIIAIVIVVVIDIIMIVVVPTCFSQNCATLKLLKLSNGSISSLERDFLNQSEIVPGPDFRVVC